MANSPQALKRARQAEKDRQLNMSARSKLRTHLKRVVQSADEGKHEETNTAFKAAVPLIDSAVNKGLIHKNKAARIKSRLNARALKLKA
ncbi:MAG: 30S ribosomal protein S20 [Cycloclasticus sp. symbiont of Poecilosclerida sp. M]|nr:MAG: 30S ribosomal protein S20 [Cycloclasticus sp. symbiont of Poecilosclerida sp. M]